MERRGTSDAAHGTPSSCMKNLHQNKESKDVSYNFATEPSSSFHTFTTKHIDITCTLCVHAGNLVI